MSSERLFQLDNRLLEPVIERNKQLPQGSIVRGPLRLKVPIYELDCSQQFGEPQIEYRFMVGNAISRLINDLQRIRHISSIKGLVRKNAFERSFPKRVFIIFGKQALPEIQTELSYNLTISDRDRALTRLHTFLVPKARRHPSRIGLNIQGLFLNIAQLCIGRTLSMVDCPPDAFGLLLAPNKRHRRVPQPVGSTKGRPQVLANGIANCDFDNCDYRRERSARPPRLFGADVWHRDHCQR